MDGVTALLASGPSSTSSRSRQANNANERHRLLEAAESNKPDAERIAKDAAAMDAHEPTLTRQDCVDEPR